MLYRIKSIIIDRSGQLLVEMLVAISVGGILLGGATMAALSVIRHNFETRGGQVATSIASELMTKAVALAEADWSNIYGLRVSTSTRFLVVSASGTNAIFGQESLLFNDVQAGLVGQWKFDEESGVPAYDYSSNANTASINGASRITGSSCTVGNCLVFVSGDYLSVPDDATLDISGNVTISAWVKWNQFVQAGSNIISKEDGGTNYSIKSYDTYLTATLGNGVDNNDSVSVNYSDAGISTGVWYLITFTSDGTNLNLYINGSLIGSSPQLITPAGNDGLLYISDPTNSLNGYVDDVRIYNRALSLEEVKVLHESAVYQRYFYVEGVQRDVNENIVVSGGTDDPATLKLTAVATWEGGRSVSFSQYITRKQAESYFQTDWTGGQLTGPATTTPPVTFDQTSNIATSSSLTLSTTTASGDLISSIYDTQDTSGVTLNYVLWHGTQPSGTTVKFQFASSNSANGGYGGSPTGPIDSTYKYAWNDSIGWIDFGTNGTVSVGTSDLSGYATNVNIGEIALNCGSTSSGDICATSNFEVTRDNGTGDLAGWAWNDSIGWISFNCSNTGSCATSDYNVNVDLTTGFFSGYAWNDSIGWISFNCTDPFPSYCPVDYKVGTQSAGGWNYVGPDGTNSTYYTMAPVTLTDISSQYHDNHRYIRYKIFLTPSGTDTPTVDDIVLGWVK